MGTMKVLSKEKVAALAARNGWSLARSEGYIDGETCRRHNTAPSKYAQIGIDEYCQGFRAAYYDRQASRIRTADQQIRPADQKQKSGSAVK